MMQVEMVQEPLRRRSTGGVLSFVQQRKHKWTARLRRRCHPTGTWKQAKSGGTDFFGTKRPVSLNIHGVGIQ